MKLDMEKQAIERQIAEQQRYEKQQLLRAELQDQIHQLSKSYRGILLENKRLAQCGPLNNVPENDSGLRNTFLGMK